MTTDTLSEPDTESITSSATHAPSDHPRAVHQAIILAAGRGSRLHPLTQNIPKCLVQVGGTSLIERALTALASQGVKEAVIVVGYKGEAIRDRIGLRFAEVDIRYVEAPEYATTNNIRSLWDAREYLDRDTLLLEADVVFDPGVIAALLAESRSSAAVAPYERALSGTVVRRDADGRVTSFTLRADQSRKFNSADTYKTVNIYLLREQLLREQIRPRLCSAIAAGDVNAYYESIFRDCVADGSSSTDLAAVDVSASRWSEIDDERDLDAAEFQFLDREKQFDRIQHLHGAYWRYGFTDHSYLYNMYFPPAEMLYAFQDNLRDIVTNYPVAQNELARLVSIWTGASPNHLAVANGAAELIKILGNQFARRLTIPTPSFNEYEEVITQGELNRFPLEPGTFELDIDAFAKSAIAWESDTVVIVTPNNPTAVSASTDDVLRLARLLENHDCRLIVDESFIEFSRAGAAGSVEAMVETFPNLTVIKSVSKVFGVAGLRLGYLLSADREFIDDVRSCLPIWNINGLAEEFLRTLGRYRNEFLESCDLTRAACRELYEDLLALRGIRPIEPDANFILCKLTDASVTGPEIARRLYVEHNILIKDCAAKSMPEADRYLRIASRTPDENRVLVSALAATL
ncbi:MAG: aminotransferase class I/II-fold pyridoxal phosphate-dependent enzyme [Gammaproteobacteria bacterium]|nr:aminotransferase class I/II-fold pyridoxal phosphate-dependent enzyme [Gammaproteobacteria bacterium]